MNPNKLTAKWSKRERDIIFHYPSKPDGHLLYIVLCCERQTSGFDGAVFSPSLVEELKRRGYDITTLRFEVTRFPKETP